MTRDQAVTIARRIMRRIEDEQAIHLDSLADELVLAVRLTPDEIAERCVTDEAKWLARYASLAKDKK